MPRLSGYKVVAAQKTGTIAKGGILYIEVPCPQGKVIVGGGAHCQDLPPGSAANYTLKSSFPVISTGNNRWMAVWTNATEFEHPQVVQFTAYAICVDK